MLPTQKMPANAKLGSNAGTEDLHPVGNAGLSGPLKILELPVRFVGANPARAASQ
jgi:hypothetical protein